MCRIFLVSILYFLLGAKVLMAQIANDECTGAIPIANVANFCSSVGQFTNVGATPSGFGAPTCFATVSRDVWFRFVAVATDVTITVRGNASVFPGGTLLNPQIALYSGTCTGVINQLECQTAQPGQHIAEAYQGGLFVGSTYLIRIQSANNSQGTFQICINNYNAPQEPQSDCPQAAILCDKSPFVVQSVSGFGLDGKELDDATCFFNGSPVNNESNSTWFVWTCSQSGTLEFKLTPLSPPDDLDFVVYRLPNGIGNCQGKQVLRCMASGDFKFPSPCMGPTGLRSGETDISENAGCSPQDNNWLAPLNMVAGETYALVVNNFTSTGNGFSIEFGGTGEFLGPEARLSTVPGAVCLGVPVQVIDASSFSLGTITGWKWSFGAEAVPQTASGPGPHTVQFDRPGTLPVVLTVETDLGCKVTDIQTVVVYPKVEVDTVIAVPDCNGGTNGGIEIANIRSGTPAYQFSWNGGPFTSDNTLSGLSAGLYDLVIRDANNCETALKIPVKEKELRVAATVMPPLCTGDSNGTISLEVTNGTPVYLFNWQDGNGFVAQNTRGNFPAGVYTILGLDGELCKGTFEVTVTDNPPLALGVDGFDISCFGANDGTSFATPGGGVGGFTYVWSNGLTGQELTSLPPGLYSVTAADANGCTIVGAIALTEPPALESSLLGVTDLTCNGIPTGSISVSASGGVPPYAYSPDGSQFSPSPTLVNLPGGVYNVVIRDANGCLSTLTASVSQPPPLQVDVQPTDTTMGLGFALRTLTRTFPAGRPVTYSWSPSVGLSDPTAPEPDITATSDQAYVLLVTDETGCTATDTVWVRVNLDRPVYIPNVFYPGGVYPNDRFTLFSGPAAELVELLQVYDRWGALVYEGVGLPLNEPNIGWDGRYKDKPVYGVFAYRAVVRFVDGAVREYGGDVTVVP